MKKYIFFILAGFGVACFTFATTAMGQDAMFGCSKKENGQLRIVGNPDQCLDSEYAVILDGSQTGVLEFDVDCNAGETVSAVLNKAPHAGELTIRVHGVCREEVYVARDDVSILGATQGAGFDAPTEDSHVLVLDGARRTNLFHLAITGGRQGIWVVGGSTFRAYNVAVSGAAINGIEVTSSSSGSIENSSIRECKYGIGANGPLEIVNTTVEDIDLFGVYGSGFTLGGGSVVQRCGHHAVYGGFSICGATIQDNQSFGVWGSGDIACSDTVIQRNQGGVVAYGGGIDLRDGARVVGNYGNGVSGFNSTVTIQGGIVSNNQGTGVELSGGSSAKIAHGAVIDSNDGDGVFLGDVSVASFWNIEDGQVSNNGGYGVNCAPSPSVSQITIYDTSFATGNAQGQINCPY